MKVRHEENASERDSGEVEPTDTECELVNALLWWTTEDMWERLGPVTQHLLDYRSYEVLRAWNISRRGAIT